MALTALALISANYINLSEPQGTEFIAVQKQGQNQTLNLFITHGHCSTPFSGAVNNLKVLVQEREDGGNPLEGLSISFETDPNTFNVCYGKELTAQIRKPGLFVGENNNNIIFKSTEVYTMGIDWYQLNGVLSIKGVEKRVKFFVSGIREANESMATSLVLEGQLNLMDWGIDYDKIVNGKSASVPTKWLHLNLRIKLS